MQTNYMMIDIMLERSKEHESLVGFYEYGSDDFYCGYVLDFNEEFVIIQHFSKYGVKDGVAVRRLSDFKFFQAESEYLKGIQLQIDKQEYIAKQRYTPKKLDELKENFSDLLESFVGNKDIVVRFETRDDELYFGFIEWSDDTNFAILEIDVDGMIVGRSVFRLEDLKQYFINDLNCRKRELLYKTRYNIKY